MLCVQLGCHECKTSHVAPRASETFSNPGDNGISAKDVDGGYGQLEFVHERNSSTLYNQKLDWLAREFSCKRRDAQEVVIPITIFDFQVVSLAIAKFGKAAAKGGEVRRAVRSQPAYTKGLCRGLRARPVCCRGNDDGRCQKSAPVHST